MNLSLQTERNRLPYIAICRLWLCKRLIIPHRNLLMNRWHLSECSKQFTPGLWKTQSCRNMEGGQRALCVRVCVCVCVWEAVKVSCQLWIERTENGSNSPFPLSTPSCFVSLCGEATHETVMKLFTHRNWNCCVLGLWKRCHLSRPPFLYPFSSSSSPPPPFSCPCFLSPPITFNHLVASLAPTIWPPRCPASHVACWAVCYHEERSAAGTCPVHTIRHGVHADLTRPSHVYQLV